MTRLLCLLAVLALAPASAQTSGRDSLPTSSDATPPAATDSIPIPTTALAQAGPDGVAVRPAADDVEPGPFSGIGLPIMIGTLLLVVLIAGAAIVTSRRRTVLLSPGSVSRLNQPMPVPRAQSGAAARPAEPLATKAEVAALDVRLARVEKHLTEQSRPPARPVQVQQAAPTPSVALPSAPQSDAATAAAAFASWCHLGGGLVDRYELFQNHIGNTLPNAVVEVVKRDLDSPARPIAFDATGGNSAAAYWLVRAGGELLLFPQPQSPQQFRDLAPAFAGNAAPQTVSSVEPARVSASGAGYVLTQPGRIA